jgi:RNA polymerase sigma-70 factor (ECF subfamily)
MHILRNTFLTSRSGLSAQRTASFEDNENVDELVVHHVTPESLLLQLESSQAVVDALAGLPVLIAR